MVRGGGWKERREEERERRGFSPLAVSPFASLFLLFPRNVWQSGLLIDLRVFYSWVTRLCTCVLVLSTSIEDDSVWSWLDVSGWLDDGSPRSISFIPPFLNGRKISSICTIISKERRTKLKHFPCCVEAVQQQNTTLDYMLKDPFGKSLNSLTLT